MLRRTVRGVLIDLSGTLHIEDLALPGAIEGVRRYNVVYVDVPEILHRRKD